MPSRLEPHVEKKQPNISVSIEESLAFKFKFWCKNNEISASNVLRRLIKEHLAKVEKHEKKK